MLNNALCVHGHFYQPSREDPWTGEIPVEKGAAPYQNWNEKIFADCYLPNIVEGNFSRISFNLGPTLTRWMRIYEPEALARIVDADRSNLEHYGCGNAMAQPYHHTILPLASLRDKRIQTAWGIEDFRFTFGHDPEGIWFPEAAVDQTTLNVASDFGIQYTILAPWQVESHESDNPSRVKTANGSSIVVFLYNRSLSSDISFNPTSTTNADQFARQRIQRELQGMGDGKILIIASDGELYGHHQPFREKFLSRLMDDGLSQTRLDVSFPGLWLKNHPDLEVTSLRGPSSWSCMHGVKRWCGECDCTPHGTWKYHLRFAMDQAAKQIDQAFEEYASQCLKDPWQSVESYAKVFLGMQNFQDWIADQCKTSLSTMEKTNLKSLLDAQVERQRMYTSCGWFFDDFDRIEPRNNVAYAAHAVWLTERATDLDLYGHVVEKFRPVSSWKTGLKGDDVFATAYYRFGGRS